MLNGLTVLEGERVRTRRKLMTVFASGRQRELVRRLSDTYAPGCVVVDVSSATDAVLTLLTGPVDVVLIDATLVGDLLNALRRHANRSSPNATLAVFGAAAPADAGGRAATGGEGLLAWTELEETLKRLLQGE